MELLIRNILKKHKNKTISILEIQRHLPGDSDIGLFNNEVQKLIHNQILIPKKGCIYSINKHLLSKSKQDKIVQTQLFLHSGIQLNAYLTLPDAVWEADYPFIFQVDRYLMNPHEESISVPECAYLITGNEKWIDEEGGKEVLQRLGVWEQLPIIGYGMPLAIAINRTQLNQSNKYLIVENKSIFYRALKVIEQLPITALIYGEGWHITSAIDTLYLQLGIKEEEKKAHQIYYFGDLDWEGIAIWHSIRSHTVLATDFYGGLLQHFLSTGKLTQNQNEVALNGFLGNFKNEEQVKIKEMLNIGKYIPQEALGTQEIIEIGRLL